MRRMVIIAGAAAVGVLMLTRLRGRGPEASLSAAEDLQYTLFAPGGPQGFWFNGPIGWAFAKVQPISHAGVYAVVADMLDLRPDDELLDIGCGPGAFLATKARHVRRVVGLDPSRTMLRAAEQRLADRLAAGTAQLELASSIELPFGDEEFSAVTAITAPANLAEVLRVLRPGGRFVYVDELIADPRKPSHERTGGSPHDWDEADFRRILEDVGFADLSVRYKGFSFLADNRIVACRKPAATSPEAAVGVGEPGVDTEERAAPAEALVIG